MSDGHLLPHTEKDRRLIARELWATLMVMGVLSLGIVAVGYWANSMDPAAVEARTPATEPNIP